LACANVANWFLFPGMLKLALLQRIEQGGFSFYYGMLGFFCVSALLLRACRLDWKFWADQLVPSVLILHAFGRIGCSLSGCCYGAPVELFGVSFDFPARELEAACLFCLYFLFEKKIRGHRFFWYLLCYSTLRFLLEFGRGDDRGVFLIEWLSPAQVTSVLIWAGLAVFMVFHRLLGNRTFPANYQSRN
ncbi:MAG: prolipoprotein diacylglyceryl transferase, partial [Clostridiales bacterium]|nr:prolipoprotein diacylglyceryl transferase [Clostridiales bacterium]